MQLKNKLYPYPVLLAGGDYYVGSTFDSKIEQHIEGFDVKLTLTVELTDKKLASMIANGDIAFAHHVECSQTCYRKVYLTKDVEKSILLKDADVNGKVQVCSFIVALKDIEKYTNASFALDYVGWKFNIERGCIMAVGNQYNLLVNKQRDDFANTSSVFSIIKNTDKSDNLMSVDIGQQKIIIRLPEITYNQYSTMKNNNDIQPMMHSMLIVPALLYIFSELSNTESLYEYEDKRWFRSLRKACAKMNIQLDEEHLKDIDAFKVAQQLLNNPVVEAIDFCTNGGECYES